MYVQFTISVHCDLHEGFRTGLQTKNSHAAIELLLTSPTLLDNLRKAHLGNYGIILSLLGCLDRGLEAKKLIDRIVDSCKWL